MFEDHIDEYQPCVPRISMHCPRLLLIFSTVIELLIMIFTYSLHPNYILSLPGNGKWNQSKFIFKHILFSFFFFDKTRWSYYRVKLEQKENWQEFLLSRVLEFRTGVLETRDGTLERGDGMFVIGYWRLVKDLNLIVMSVSW